MLKFIMSAFKPVCNHKRGGIGNSTLYRVSTIHGDMIHALNGKRSLWKCNQCGKFVWSKSLTEVKK